MGVQFYTGRSGTGKTVQLQNEIVKAVSSEPAGEPIIYLVPDQMTFQAEKELVSGTGTGMIRAQVLSFSRLALRVLQEACGAARPHIDKTGYHMLLRKIVEQRKGELKLFQKAASNPGFINKMEQMLTEFTRYNIDAQQLEKEMQRLHDEGSTSNESHTLLDKLHDIHIVFSQSEKELKGKYLAAEDYLQLLADRIPESGMLKEATIYVDGFHSFTPAELSVICGLMKQAKEVHIALTLDKPPAENEMLHPLDLFFETSGTFQELVMMCQEAGISDISHHVFKTPHRFKTDGLLHLEAQGGQRPVNPSENHDGVHVISAVSRRAEVERVAREIVSLVRDSRLRFNDIAVLLRNPGEYTDYVDMVFYDEGIPFFMDQKRPVLNHPVIEFIRSSLEVVLKHWRYEAVFRMLKTEVLFSGKTNIRQKVDQLENYALAYGIQGSRWYDGKPWQYSRMATTAESDSDKTSQEKQFEKEINKLKEHLLQPVIEFQGALRDSDTVEDYCRAVFELLKTVKAAGMLERIRDKAVESGHLREAREHDQLWNDLIHVFNQIVEMSGDEHVSLDMFIKMIETGFESMRFSIIPPAFDQVVIADMETSRLSNVKAAFIMGANDGILPAKPDEGSMISEGEREILEQGGTRLAPGAKRQLLNENFIMYTAQSVPEEKLYLTYPIADEEGKSLQPSMYLNFLYDAFPLLETELAPDSPADLDQQDDIAFISTPYKTLSYLTSQLQRYKKGYPLSGVWQAAYNWFISDSEWYKRTATVLASLNYRNSTVQISKQLTEELYGSPLKTSVSRLERYNACPFSQFASYGLKLKERETFKLEAPDIGTLFHAALKEMAESLRKEKRDFSNLSKQEAAVRAGDIVGKLAPKIQREILLSSKRFNYIQQKLEDVIARAANILAEQAKQSGFSPVGLEVGFGPDQELPPLTFNMDDGTAIELAGRIDRVDQAKAEDGVYVRILDYKSSAKDVRLDDVYYGLALQMLVYLDVVVSSAAQWLGTRVSPAGVLYFHVHNPMINADEKLTLEEIEQRIFKEFKMKGLMSASPEAIRQMDLALESGRSDIVPVGLKKDGQAYADSKVIADEHFHILRSYLRQHIKTAGEAILNGDVSIQPYKKKQAVPCTFCPYKSLCQFDPALETNDYRHLPDQSSGDILSLMEREGGESHENEPET